MKKIPFLLLALLLVVGLSSAQGTRPQTGGKKGAASSSSAPKAEKLDINTAGKEQLQALPGIGPAIAQKIIDGRPYRAKNDLVRRKIISQAEYEKITDLIIAHRVKGAAPAGKKTGAKSSGK